MDQEVRRRLIKQRPGDDKPAAGEAATTAPVVQTAQTQSASTARPSSGNAEPVEGTGRITSQSH